MTVQSLTLIVPGLLGNARMRGTDGALQDLALPALAQVLGKASRLALSPRGLSGLLFDCFDIYADSAELPVAAITAANDGVTYEGYCLRADPVHVKADRDRLLMLGNDGLQVTQTEAEALAGAFNQLFAEDGLTLHTPAPLRWYLTMAAAPQLTTSPLQAVVGQDVDPHLPQGEQALHWHKILNEIQMLFYTHPVNEARRARGQMEINSVWLWGGGELTATEGCGWTRVWSNEFVSQSLARHFDVAISSAPPSAEEWLEQVDTKGEHLLVLDGASAVTSFEDIGRWRDFVAVFDEEWLSPLLAALRAGQLQQLNLHTVDGHCFQLGAKHLRRWWRRPQPLVRFRS